MRAVTYHRYGDPSVLRVEDVPEPHAGPGHIRIRVAAAGVNPIDWKLRAGYLHEMFPLQFPKIPGRDAAGVVDEVGAGVTGIATASDDPTPDSLVEMDLEKREAELAQLRGEHIDASFGTQIRSYVLHPYTMVKDLRTAHETGDVNGVLDGDLDPFVEAYLAWSVGRAEAAA